MNSDVYYSPKEPTLSADHNGHVSKIVSTPYLTEYSSSQSPYLPDATESVAGKLRGFRSELSPRPSSPSPRQLQVNLPRLRDLDIFHPAKASNSTTSMTSSMTYSPRLVGSCESFPRPATLSSDTQSPIPLATNGCCNGLPLSNATPQCQHRSQNSPLAVEGCLLNWLPASPQTSAPASRRRRRPTSRPHCNVRYTSEQLDCIDNLHGSGLSWERITEEYNAMFPSDAEKGHERRPQGLQGVFYRRNKQASI
ncbi:uncharacterized protein CTRU02_212535 [Colletotrichum truncatum]|uniref:Uncharacterized protein n=3 Tax=Colletotrichum truncatum TaxID=5467 RepID=A0ACC3YCC1_COLTU